MKINNILWLVVSISLLSSCGLFRKKSRDIQKQEVAYSIDKTGVKVSSDITVETGKATEVKISQDQTRETTTDRGKIVTESEETTTKTRPPTNSNFKIGKEDLSKNGTFHLVDSFGNVLTGKFDSMASVLDINLQTRGVNETKNKKTRTTQENDGQTIKEGNRNDSTRSESEGRRERDIRDSAAMQQNETFKAKSKDDRRKSSPDGLQIALAIGASIIFIIIIIYVVKRRNRP